VDGYYKWVYNSLAIYAGIINSPWFDPSQPAVMNFGSMGTFMGHEVTHGYDSFGWHFDERGKLRSMHEAESGQEMMQNMDQRMECFVRQYGQYGVCIRIRLFSRSQLIACFKDESRRTNGRFTLSENIADNGGIRASYKAWQQFKTANPEEARWKPEGFQQFTDEQLLFISSAFVRFCPF
jgi:endothelin-converting enzyme